MAYFAVIDGIEVVNTILADSVSDAETLTGKTCVEYTDESPIGIGWEYNNSKKAWVAPKPFPSWTLKSDNTWQAPKNYPRGGGFYLWDETEQNWIAASQE